MQQDTWHGDQVWKSGQKGYPWTQDSTLLDLTPQDHHMPEGDNDSSDNIVKKLTLTPWADLLEQFQQLKNQFENLKSNMPQSTPTEELLQLTDKLQHLTMVLQPAPPVQCLKPCRHTKRIQSHHNYAQRYPHIW